MALVNSQFSTGLSSLDRMLTGLMPGDNVVWQVASLQDYLPFVEPYCRNAVTRGSRLVYFRFAKHEPLIGAARNVEIREMHPEAGFEAFVSGIHDTIERAGKGGYYLFDMLSGLAADWYSDQMLGNFFMLTCPYLYDVGALAYFGLLQGYHSSEAIAPISETAQILIDVFRHKGRTYVHPKKVHQRYSPTMYTLHEKRGDDFLPVTQSATISDVMIAGPWPGLESTRPTGGVVNRAFTDAEEALSGKCASPDFEREAAETLRVLLRACFSRDERVLRLLEQYLTLKDVLAVKKRMIGTGLIGGKSVGMLLARAILRKHDARWEDILETHDSFYVGSDVYYTYVVRNGLWWLRERQKDKAGFLEGTEQARQSMLAGTFPDYVVRQFTAMLDYFGQSPIIIRSSSLLEDNFGNSFAGKYDSIFCANQGPRHKRLEDLLSAVRAVYASTMSEKALRYRAQRDLLKRDEQMALLIQRVSGGMYGGLFYPQVSGVGLSYNPYVWSSYIDPEAGVLRMVFGLGTRAVDRCDDDYTRIVALNAPERRPDLSIEDVRRHSQKKVDVIDLAGNRFVCTDFASVVSKAPEIPLHLFVPRESGTSHDGNREGSGQNPIIPNAEAQVLTFERLISDTNFIADMRQMLDVLEKAYSHPVDVEFTANFSSEKEFKINLVQCRPLQVKGGSTSLPKPSIRKEDVVLEARGAVIGRSRVENIDRIIYITPSTYSALPTNTRYSVARLVGRVVHHSETASSKKIMLIGPGRWGTTTPSLGVPVHFSEINAVSVLCEIVAMRDGLVPDVSLGTHFFNELVELDMLYVGLFPGKEGNILNAAFFESAPNRLGALVPGESALADVVRVFDVATLPGQPKLVLSADSLAQEVVCSLQPGDKENNRTR